jgi:molybdopterin converting factor small subunit
MTIHLALFAYLSQYQPDGQAGRQARSIDVADGATVGALIARLGLPDGPRVVLVNGRHAADDRPLSDGDRLAIFPQIAGG